VVCAVVKGKAYRPGLTFDADELGAIRHPVLHVYGAADPVGSPEIWRHVAGVLPRGELLVVDGAGHMPWFDDPKHVAAGVSRFLRG
jgi:pimeloyl-ACP methyl ester carboxylesterase